MYIKVKLVTIICSISSMCIFNPQRTQYVTFVKKNRSFLIVEKLEKLWCTETDVN